MEMSWVDDRGVESFFGAWVSCSSQVPSNSRAFSKSSIGSEIVLHSAGPFAPPKVSLSDISTYNVPLQLI